VEPRFNEAERSATLDLRALVPWFEGTLTMEVGGMSNGSLTLVVGRMAKARVPLPWSQNKRTSLIRDRRRTPPGPYVYSAGVT